MVARFAGVAGHGIAADAHQSLGLADAAAVGDLLQDGDGLLPGQVGMEQRRRLAFGEPVATGTTSEEADRVAFAVVAADGEVFTAPEAMVGALGIQAAEPSEVVQGPPPATYLRSRSKISW
jgi:hypothetical protein